MRCGTPDPSGRDGLGRRILELRGRLPLSRTAFAQRIGVSRNMIPRYERGTSPRAEILDRIAEIGGVSLEWLLHGRGTAPLEKDTA